MVCCPAGAEDRTYRPYANIERGTDGLSRVILTIENATDGAIRCTASLAHWYSQPLGAIGPDESIDMPLWHDPQTGTLSLLNDGEDRMPVEAISCGPADNADVTRTRLPLPFTRGDLPGALRRVCVDYPDGPLSCPDPDGI